MSHTSSPEIDAEYIDEDNTAIDDPQGPQGVLQILESEKIFESPIDINISKTIPVTNVLPLRWVNYELPPKKMKITNTGHTVILSGKWGQERPYITDGVLSGKYVFSQMHLHWGVNDMEGSEHTIDGCHYPGELHLVTFKSSYLTQESALKEKDGVVIFAYIFRLQDPPNPGFQIIVDALPGIAQAHTSSKIPPAHLSFLTRQFDSDYFMYRGSVSTSDCVHHITWLITRIPLGVSPDQVDSLRFLLDSDDELLRRNFRPVHPLENRPIFHVLPSTSKYSTLLPIPDLDNAEKTVTQIYRFQLYYNDDLTNFYENIKETIVVKSSSKCKSQLKQSLHDADMFDNRILHNMIEDIRKYINSTYYSIVFFIYVQYCTGCPIFDTLGVVIGYLRNYFFFFQTQFVVLYF